MGRLRGWLRRLEGAARGEYITIEQEDGTISRFKPSDYREAFLAVGRTMDGEERCEPHPMNVAASNASEEQWRSSFLSLPELADGGDVSTVEDLSD